MCRIGACSDNPTMQSFLALLQKNVLKGKRRETREELPPRDRDLDREDLPPPTTTSRPQRTHVDRF